MSETELETALKTITANDSLPMSLPLAHLTAWRFLETILELGELQPRKCTVFDRNLLYLSYGGVLYRTGELQTERVTELPVALVLSPKVLETASCFYPFDSGAMASGRFGSSWSATLDPFPDRFSVRPSCVHRPASTLVKALYGSNSQYIAGNPDASSVNHPAPIPTLYRLLVEDLSAFDIDHRHRSIEELTEIPVQLSQHLLWIGFPRIIDDVVLKKVYNWTQPNLPGWWSYPYHRNFNPRELAAALEAKARQDVFDRYLEFPK